MAVSTCGGGEGDAPADVKVTHQLGATAGRHEGEEKKHDLMKVWSDDARTLYIRADVEFRDSVRYHSWPDIRPDIRIEFKLSLVRKNGIIQCIHLSNFVNVC